MCIWWTPIFDCAQCRTWNYLGQAPRGKAWFKECEYGFDSNARPEGGGMTDSQGKCLDPDNNNPFGKLEIDEPELRAVDPARGCPCCPQNVGKEMDIRDWPFVGQIQYFNSPATSAGSGSTSERGGRSGQESGRKRKERESTESASSGSVGSGKGKRSRREEEMHDEKERKRQAWLLECKLKAQGVFQKAKEMHPHDERMGGPPL
ncbi:hypothetical protein B0J14DRAFT_269330 [Halenospora varia]|nr:hypothetical protein B0J14DRAFT_269330 [Halenospora varia]